MIAVFILCLIGVCLIGGFVYEITRHGRHVIHEQRSINRRKRHVPYREIGFTACKPQEDIQ